MTAPSYTTDLTSGVVTLCADNTGWSELNGHTSGGADATETDYYIQGSACVSQSTGAATGTTAGMEYDYGSNITGFTTGDCFFFWQIFLAPNAIDTWANGGMRIGVGSTTGNIKFWKAVGNDFGRYPYGGWTNTAIDPTYTADYTEGTATSGNYRIFASWPNILSAVSKGNPHGVDAIRFGRGELIIQYGSLADGYGTFAGIAAQNDGTSNRWGLLQKQGAIYLWKGLMSFGNATNACDFRDSNVNITVDDTPRTYAAFNRIVITNASSIVYWTNVVFSAANASQLSRGQFEMASNADVRLTSCQFVDWDTTVLLSNAVLSGCTFLRTNAVTAPGCDLRASNFLTPTVAADTGAVVWNANVATDGKLDSTIFSKGTNAHHAIQFGSSAPTSMTLRGISFSGFNASNGQNDSTLLFADRGSNVTWTISLIGCTGNISYKKARSGDTVVLDVDPVTLAVHVQDINTGTSIQYARVWVPVTSTAGGRPYNTTVSITRSGTTATVSHTSHNMITNDWVWISGCTDPLYNGTFQITKTSDDAYTYVMSDTPVTSPAAGSPKATFVVINAETDSSGNATASKSWLSDQPVSGRVRYGASPYYKTAPVSGTIDSTSGLAVTVQLIPDA
jgi:hypothetical protein